MPRKSKAKNRYEAIIERIFQTKYKKGLKVVPFKRDDLELAAQYLKISSVKNLGDILYSFRYRNPLPQSILATQPSDMQWIIKGTGTAQYAFRLVRINRILPNESLSRIKIPDATPEIILAHGLSDEQALLAHVRYNRLIDVFLGLTTYSLQNHLRTSVRGIGPMEIDEVYAGLDTRGCQYVIPVQAKGGKDQLSSVQTEQDIECCAEKFPDLKCRPVSTQFMDDETIAMFELTVEDDEIRLVDERHYRLVPSDEISAEDLKRYRTRSKTP